MNDSIVNSLIEIEPVTSDTFLKVKETLTRIGIVSRKNSEDGGLPILWQSCHILHKQGRYYIVHFKQLFLLDGKNQKTNFSKEDQDRTNLIASLLEKWNLVKLVHPVEYDESTKVVVIPFREKENWDLMAKYSIGGNRGRKEND